jgi:hypothetical protein
MTYEVGGAVCAAAIGLALVACGGDDGEPAAAPSLPQGGEPVELDPAESTTETDNPY